jgi:hypothetical protein
MKRSTFFSLLVIGLACAYTPSEAVYQFAFIHGISCTSITSGANPGYTQFGVSNSTNSAIVVNCPLAPTGTGSLKSIYYTVWGWSRNSANKLSCSVNTTSMEGGALATSTATPPYNVNASTTASATTYPQPVWTPWPYLTCNIPPVQNGWISYLSTIQVRYEY